MRTGLACLALWVLILLAGAWLVGTWLIHTARKRLAR